MARAGSEQTCPGGGASSPCWRGALYRASASLARVKPAKHQAQPTGPVAVAAFVHSAFWRPATDDESYIGPILREVSARVGRRSLALIGLGAPTNFRSRNWRQRCRELLGWAGAPLPFSPARSYASGSGAGAIGRRVAAAKRSPTRVARERGSPRRLRLSRMRRVAADEGRVHRHLAPPVPLVGARDGRDRSGPRRGEAPCGHHLRGGRRFRPRVGPRGAPARHQRRRAPARLHLPSLAELPARTGRDGAIAGQPRRPRVSTPHPHARLRPVRRRAPGQSGAFPAGEPRGRREPETRRVRRNRTPDGRCGAGGAPAEGRRAAWPAPRGGGNEVRPDRERLWCPHRRRGEDARRADGGQMPPGRNRGALSRRPPEARQT